MDDDKEKKEEERLDAAGKNRCIIIIQSEWIFFQRDTNVMILSMGVAKIISSPLSVCEFISIVTKIEERKYKVLI